MIILYYHDLFFYKLLKKFSIIVLRYLCASRFGCELFNDTLNALFLNSIALEHTEFSNLPLIPIGTFLSFFKSRYGIP